MLKRLKIFAHRGASGTYPENTLLAFTKAAELKVDGIELDVRLTKDNKLVVIHDETTKRTTGKDWKICERTFDELKTLDAGGWMSFYGEKIPSLEDAFNAIHRSIIINVEIKRVSLLNSRIEEEVLKAVKKHKRLDSVIISSFDHFIIRRIKKIEPKTRAGLLFSIRTPYIPYLAKRVSAEFVNIHKNYADFDDIKVLSKKGFKVMVWEISSIEEAEDLAEAGVWGIFTNNPEIFKTCKTGRDRPPAS